MQNIFPIHLYNNTTLKGQNTKFQLNIPKALDNMLPYNHSRSCFY